MNKRLEVLLYTCWGFFTTGINFGVIYILYNTYEMDSLNANIIAWLISNYVMYVGLKRTVFHSKTHGIKEYVIQLNYYYISRVITLALEEVILWKLVTIEEQPIIYVKILSTILIGVLNLVFSKAIVFHCTGDNQKREIKSERGYLV